MSIHGKNALVTGAARRVGRAIALELAQAGCNVAVHYRGSAREANALAAEIVAMGRQAGTFQADLGAGAVRSLRTSVSELERRMIQEALERNRWNKAKVARELGLSYPTLLGRIKSLQLERRRS